MFSRVARGEDVVLGVRHASTRSNDLAMYKLYSMQRSGNSYKVRLALALLNAPYRAIDVDILRG